MIEQWATLKIIPVRSTPNQYEWLVNVNSADINTTPDPYAQSSQSEMPAWSSELKYRMNQLIKRGWKILKRISSKKRYIPKKRSRGAKALAIALVKLGLYFDFFSEAFFLFSNSLFHSCSSLLPRAWDSSVVMTLYKSSFLRFFFDPSQTKVLFHLYKQWKLFKKIRWV